MWYQGREEEATLLCCMHRSNCKDDMSVMLIYLDIKFGQQKKNCINHFMTVVSFNDD